MPSNRALELIEDLGARDGRLLHVERLPARPARTAEWPAWADPAVVAGYRRLGIERPWLHQAEAAEAIHAGRHTVLATGTGSGKSLPSWLAALSALREGAEQAPASGSIARYRRRPTTIYLAPTKALAADQLTALTALVRAAGIGARAATCDGDTPLTERDWVRDHADIVLTNPDFLHFTLLPAHHRWVRLLRGLSHVVVDEGHAYRGVTGAHVALVLRRLLRIARHLGADPTVVVASATTAAPAVTTARLIGVDPGELTTITEDASPTGRRTIALWQAAQTEPLDPDVEAPRRAATTEAAHLLADLVVIRSRTLAFVRSRASAEYVAERARQELADVDPELASAVGAYRGGYLPEERRAIERALRDGELLGLATTNALELGIDISGLDAVLIAGWPGSRASIWQQSGRAGRAGADGLAVFIASDDPLDSYLVHHPEAIFGTPVEATAFDPANPYVLGPHLCAAAAELPLTTADFPLFGLADDALLAALVARDLLRARPSGWYWNIALGGRAQDLTDLRGSGGGEVQVVESLTGAVLGTAGAGTADSQVHPGAVYVHQGRVHVVEDLVDGVALVRHENPGYRTRTQSVSSLRVLGTDESWEWQGAAGATVTWGFGPVEVTSQVTGYDRLLPPSMEIVGHYALDMPERLLPTKAVWWSVPEAACADAGIPPDELPGALHAAEHAAIGILPLLATCDRWDIGGVSTAHHPDTGAPTVFVHDGFPGGAGFAERGARVAREWLEATLAVIAGCRCEAGCPACIQSPKCGTGNSPLSKDGAVRLLRLVLAAEAT